VSKYYPNTGWCPPASGQPEPLEQFLKDHDHRDTSEGKYVRIIYDSEFSEFAKERDDVMRWISSVLKKQ
jgi:hypothetical protein